MKNIVGIYRRLIIYEPTLPHIMRNSNPPTCIEPCMKMLGEKFIKNSLVYPILV
jgi:hypothetical protein